MEKQRARNPEEKAFRKQSLVLALRELLLKSRCPLPSVHEIARTAGVSKGVAYLYFESREEIFLTLHLQESFHFFEKMKSILSPGEYTLEKARDFVVQYFTSTDNEIFMFLGLISPTILETNINAAFALEFKQKIAKGIDGLAHDWMRVEPGPGLSSMRNFILRYYYLAMMLWQHHHPPDVIRQAFPKKDLWLVGGDLKRDLKQSFDWLWTGMRNS